MSTRRLRRSMVNAATHAGQDAVNATVTVAARLPVLAAGLVAPTGASMAEWNRAYSEKVAAAWSGAFAAAAIWQTTMIMAAFRPPMPAAFADDLMRAADAAMRPGRRTCKANARRLTRR